VYFQAELAAELTAGHPVTGAYDADAATAAGQVNAQNVVRIRASMSGQEMFENTDSADYAGLTDAKKAEWISFCGIDTHDPRADGTVQEFVIYIFGGGSDTVTNLSAARNETVSQAVVLGFPEVTASHVLVARGEV